MKIKPILDRLHVPFWLDWGTLLGCVRGGDLIPHDNDIDIGILAETWTPHLAQVLRDEGLLLHPTYCHSGPMDRFLAGMGPKAPRGIGVRQASVPAGGAWMDICPYVAGAGRRLEGRSRYWCSNTGYLEFPSELVENWQEVSFLGARFRIPADAPAYLMNIYGPSWTVPMVAEGDNLTDLYPHYVQLEPVTNDAPKRNGYHPKQSSRVPGDSTGRICIAHYS
jgi:hypothetical protein